MKKYAKILAICFVVALLAVCFAGCAAPAASDDAAASENTGDQESQVAAIKDAGKLIMLTNAAFPPFEYLGEGGEEAGVDIDIAQAVADELGVELVVEDMDFKGLIAALQSKKGDLVAAGMTVTEERLESVDFSTKYIKSAQYMLVKKGVTDIKTLEDLEGKIIGVQEGTTGDLYASGDWDDTIQPGAKSVERFDTAIDAAMALINGKLDVVIIDEMPAKAILESNAEELDIVSEPLTEEEYAVALRKNSDLLPVVNKVLEKLMEEGTINDFIIKHTS